MTFLQIFLAFVALVFIVWAISHFTFLLLALLLAGVVWWYLRTKDDPSDD